MARDRHKVNRDHRYSRMRRVGDRKMAPTASRTHQTRIEFESRPCSFTELAENERGERVIVRLNDTAHL
jgi:hypothetical protein